MSTFTYLLTCSGYEVQADRIFLQCKQAEFELSSALLIDQALLPEDFLGRFNDYDETSEFEVYFELSFC